MAKEMLMEKLSGELSDLIARASRSIVLVHGRRSPSPGIVWQKNLVVAADHTLPRVEELQISTPTGEVLAATVAGRDPSLDVALLKTTKELTALEPAQDPLKAGQLAIALGRANRGRDLALLTLVSGAGGAYRNWRGGTLDQFIRLDAVLYPGFSGSALLLPNGKVAGMNTSAFSSHFGLAVPASNIERLVQRLSAKGSIGRPYLGLLMQPVRIPKTQRQQSGAEIGLLVMGTEEGSPAEQAGLLMGDLLVRLDEKTLDSTDEIHDRLSEDSIGKEIQVGILRAGSPQNLKIIVGERPLRKRTE